MAKKDATPQKIDEPIDKKPKDPQDAIGSGIFIDGKKMKAMPPPAPASAASSPMSKAKGGCVKMAKGGVTRGDGCAQRGKTRGRNC